MALPKLKSEFDVDAYMAWEEDQPERHEYLGGEEIGRASCRERVCLVV